MRVSCKRTELRLALPSRATANAEDIPVGARFMDPEISAAVSINVGQGMVSISQVMGMPERRYSTMFAKYLKDKIMFGAKLLRMNKDKGWIIPPPLHTSN